MMKNKETCGLSREKKKENAAIVFYFKQAVNQGFNSSPSASSRCQNNRRPFCILRASKQRVKLCMCFLAAMTHILYC